MNGVGPSSPPDTGAALAIGRAAVRALYQELTLEPKPGLVSLRDSGSHDDMDAATFMRSLFALRGAFTAMARAGAEAAPFERLQTLGLRAEARMLAATGGVNTHRGAVFALGLLCASAGAARQAGQPMDAAVLRATLRAHWGAALAERAERARRQPARSHGQRAARRLGLRGAGDEAAAGFPVLFDVTWPALVSALDAGAGPRAARVQALFATIAQLDDTNLAHRGGLAALHEAQRTARGFLLDGGVLATDWLARARAIHRHFVQRRWSPGGAADLLGCACWLDAVVTADRPQIQAASA